ncbi:hypothetical protein [Micromonospora sp. NPDC051296]|uniref:hypothetical protein n=1 Tax=Micromonospora sp. NPDC051296 TaxID=3155046 RepID=UPI0034404663
MAHDRRPDGGARHQVTANAVETLHRLIVAHGGPNVSMTSDSVRSCVTHPLMPVLSW